MKKYNLSEIMKNAWNLFKRAKEWKSSISTFSDALKRAWAVAKARLAEDEADAKRRGIVRMHYAEYKNNYSECRTVKGSYDKRTKTIEVITRKDVNGLCPHCHTWCYGDCQAAV